MGKGGPRPTAGKKRLPTAIKLQRGSSNPLPGAEPILPVGCVKPFWLSVEAEKQWERISKQLVDAQMVSYVDSDSVGMLGEVIAKYLENRKLRKELGILTPDGQNETRASRLENVMMDRMLKFYTEFGMTPASRARVHWLKPSETENQRKARIKQLRTESASGKGRLAAAAEDD